MPIMQKKTDHMKGTATGNINMDVYKMYQSTPPTVNNHLVNKRYVVSNFVIKGDQLKGTAVDNINMDTYVISQQTNPTIADHLSNKYYVDTRIDDKTLDLYSRWWVCRGISRTTYALPRSLISGHTPSPPIVLSDELSNSKDTAIKIVSLTLDSDTVPSSFSGIRIDFKMSYSTKSGVQGSVYLGNVSLGTPHIFKDADSFTRTFYINASVNLHNTIGATLTKTIRFFNVQVKQTTSGGTTLSGNESAIFVCLTN